jgi:hypothetical protein
MMRSISKFGWLCGVLLLSAPAFAQTAPDISVAAALSSLSARADVVFAGEVTAVRPVGGVVEVEFQVDQNLKGPVTGSYVLREWAGLWAAGQRRYWVGEHAVVFLHEAGKSGLSSSVDGMEGILPITVTGDMTTGPSADVERLRARVLREAGAPMVDSAAEMSLAAVALIVQPQPAGAPVAPPIETPIVNPILYPRPLPTHEVPINLLPLQGPGAVPQTDEPQRVLRAPVRTLPESLDAGH